MEERAMPPREIEPLADSKGRRGPRKPNTGGEISVTNLSARWTAATNDAHTLHNISLKVSEGQLLAVVGSVGSGKVRNIGASRDTI